jgi:hypothetical protein
MSGSSERRGPFHAERMRSLRRVLWEELHPWGGLTSCNTKEDHSAAILAATPRTEAHSVLHQLVSSVQSRSSPSAFAECFGECAFADQIHNQRGAGLAKAKRICPRIETNVAVYTCTFRKPWVSRRLSACESRVAVSWWEQEAREHQFARK